MGQALVPVVCVERALPSRDAQGILEVLRLAWSAYINTTHNITQVDIDINWPPYTPLWRVEFAAENMSMAIWRRKEVLLVARARGLVVGVCRLQPHQGMDVLQALYVHPAFQGRGIGSLLWGEAQRYLRPGVKTRLWVVAYNARAKSIYRAWGFWETGRRDVIPFRHSHKKMPVLEMERAN